MKDVLDELAAVHRVMVAAGDLIGEQHLQEVMVRQPFEIGGAEASRRAADQHR